MPVTGTPELVGRRDEVARLCDALAVAAAGRSAVVLIEGEPGIGKSRLVAETMTHAADRGFRVLHGVCDEIEHTRPFGPLTDAFHTGADLSASAPLAAVVDAPTTAASYAVVDAFVDAAEQAALQRPLLIALDDLQWADGSTLLVVRALARRLGDLPIAIIGAYRPVPRRTDLEALVQRLIAEGAHLLTVGRLPDADVADLLGAALGAPAGPGLLDAGRGASGNPFFALELARALEEEDRIRIHDGVVDLVSPGLPPSLRLTILRRLSFLPEESLDDLKMACVLGSTFTMRELCAVTGRSPGQVARALDACIRAGLVEGRDDALAFRHDLIREALYEDMPVAVRRGLHRETARLLEQAGEPIPRVAAHVALGADPGDGAAFDWLLKNGVETLRSSESEAIALFELAHEVGDDRARVKSARWLAAILPNHGRATEADELAAASLALAAEPEMEEFLLLCLAHPARRRGALADEVAHTDRVRRRLPTEGPFLAEILVWLSDCELWTGQIDAAEAHALELRGIDNNHSRCGSEMQLAQVSLARGHLDAARSHASSAVALAAPVWQEVFGRPLAQLWHAMVLIDADRFDDAGRALQHGRRQADERGVVAQLPLYQWYLALARYLRGEWDDAVAEAEAGLDLAAEIELRQWIETPLAVLARVALHRGDRAAAEHALAIAERDDPTNPIGALLVGWCRALMHEADGDVARAASVLGRRWDEMGQRRNFLLHRCIAPDLVRMALSCGDRMRAERVTELMEEVASNARVASAEAAALRCRGLLEDDPDVLLQAVEAARRSPRPVERARACEDSGASLARAGRTGEAAALLDEAIETYEAALAVTDARRARAILREAGIHRRASGPTRTATSGWDSLTPSEVEVARLVAEDLTNPQIAARLFISRHTVRAHLRHIFAKLACASRVELAERARER